MCLGCMRPGRRAGGLGVDARDPQEKVHCAMSRFAWRGGNCATHLVAAAMGIAAWTLLVAWRGKNLPQPQAGCSCRPCEDARRPDWRVFL